MLFSSVLFAILFAFLLLIFLIVASAFFKKEDDYSDFTPYVSVVIPAYNEEKNIGECINSIKAQNYPQSKIEIIVVDDGSSDKTVEIAKISGAVVFSQLHKGKSEALNLGSKKSSRDFIATIDADTILDKDCLKNLLRPFSDETVGATTGNSIVRNNKNIIELFQSIEYYYNNLIRISFSKVFKESIWFFGALACYKKSVLQKAGFFKTDTLTEDMDIALEISRAGFKAVNVYNASGSTSAPSNLRELYSQRARWWIGTLQALIKNKQLFLSSSIPLIFLFVNQFWWSFYSFMSIPLIIYQINYWLPYNSSDFLSVFNYFFRWFSLAGPFYVLYKIPEWGISIYNIFGVLSGLISAIMMLSAFRVFKQSINIRYLFGMFFYFPYTIFLNIFIVISLIKWPFCKKRFFIR